MDKNMKDFSNKYINENFLRKEKDAKLTKLNYFRSGYNSDKFISDLENYFSYDVDFNLDKIRQVIEASGQLEELISRAKEKNTHPVSEFVQNIFKRTYF